MAPRGIITALTGLMAACLAWSAGAAPARQPAQEFTVTGGASVSGFGEWGIIADFTAGGGACALQLYRLNYLTMSWAFFGQILESNPQCDTTEFGSSSSLVGDVLVVGAPGWAPGANPRGTFFVYIYDDVDDLWVVAHKQQAAITPQQNSRYGESVSVTRIGETDDYLIAVGAPLFDSGLATDGGKVEAWRINSVTGTLVPIGSVPLAVNNANFGASVTTDYPFILAGAPGGTVAPGNATGFAQLIEAVDGGDADTLPDALVPSVQTVPDPAIAGALSNERLGANVSMSAAYALVSGDQQAFIFENVGTPATRTYEIREQSPNVPYALPATSGGDVTQSAGVAAIADGVLGSETVNILRDPVVDDFDVHAVGTNPAVDPGGVLTDMQDDIRLARETLWFSNVSADRAFLYQYPAGFGLRQVGFQFYQRSLPCNVGGTTVDDVFFDLGVASTNGSDGDYAVWGYDPTNVRSANPYRLLTGDYVFGTNPGDEDWALWIVTDGANDVGPIPTGEYVAANTCNGFTAPDAAFPAPMLGGVPARVKAQKQVQLPDSAGPDETTDFARVMVNNPFPREVHVSDIRYVAPSGALKTLAQAQTDNELLATVFVYDPGYELPSGQNYRAISAAGTPPFQDQIQAQEGFWVKVLNNGKAVGNTHYLLMPQTE